MINRIVVGTDGSTQAMAATRWAAELANQLGGELLIVHVFEVDPVKLPGGYISLPPEQLEAVRTAAQKHLDGPWSDTACGICSRSRTILEAGNAAESLIDVAQREMADLLVVGNRGRGGFAGLLLGSVGHRLTQHARIPVTIIPTR